MNNHLRTTKWLYAKPRMILDVSTTFLYHLSSFEVPMNQNVSCVSFGEGLVLR